MSGDAALWRDLLGRARGNHKQAAEWMAQIGANVPLAARAAREVPGTASVAEVNMLLIDHRFCSAMFPSVGVRPDGPGSNDLDVRAAEAGAPATFFCPISFKCFRDPVLLPTGQTYVAPTCP